MNKPKVDVFFYGSYINLNVLKEVNIIPDQIIIAKLSGYDIQIAPRANLVKSEKDCVYGILTKASHEELQRLYVEHAQGILGETYLPEAVLVETINNAWVPTLCYIAPSMKYMKPEIDYINRIILPAKQLKFPKWYICRLEQFKSQDNE